jgi:hypothetical protein
LQPCKNIRSTLLLSSMRALRERGHFERYARVAPPGFATRLAAAGAPQWLPIALAEAHYGACDALGLSELEVLALGGQVATVQASGIQVLLRAARAGGATPWTALRNINLYWSRMYDGSAVRIVERGPKDVLLVVESNALVRIDYWRIGLRGILGALGRGLSTSAYVNEIRRADPSSDSVTYSLAWV